MRKSKTSIDGSKPYMEFSKSQYETLADILYPSLIDIYKKKKAKNEWDSFMAEAHQESTRIQS